MTTTEKAATSAGHPVPANRDPALDGIRGIAVLAVVVYHLGAPWLPGGFLGVDVFFVLSGFLITRLLAGELGATGRIDLARFWVRRARRLLPALFALLAVLVVYAATRPPEMQKPLRDDLLSSLLYVTNWQFVLEGRSYFGEFQLPSPLRHLWSLAIEEQFYLVFPLVLIVLARIGQRRRAAVWGAGVLLSAFALAWFYDEADPSRAYYGTDTRLHELLIGAGLALCFGPISGLVRKWLAPVALAGLAVLFLTVDDRGQFYYHGGSLVVSLVTAALIAGAVAVPYRPLSWPPPAALGRISYGVYLWHWPVIVVLTPESIGVSDFALVALRTAVTLAVSVASYHLLEMPVRRGAVAGFRLPARRFLPGALVVLAGLFGGTFAATAHARPEPAYVRQSDGLIVPRDADPHFPVVGLVGDSVAASLQPGLASAARQRGYTLVSGARPGCGVGTSLLLDETGHPFPRSEICAERTPRLQHELIDRFHPRAVLWHSARDRMEIRAGGRRLHAGTPEWTARLYANWDAALNRLSAQGTRVIVLLPAWGPGASAQSSCGGELNLTPAECDRTSVTTEHLRRLYREWAGHHPQQVSLLDLGAMLCPGGLPCPPDDGPARLRADGVHFTEQAARRLAPRILDLAALR
ncbi:acyltransferase family protein [Spongiactinospora sp. 9N601]|uniref:acyltransferase family protein n=1 Tax=Spongiactinospora sp. 9N601 TaxID=3375149 RepID=UPI0037B090AE